MEYEKFTKAELIEQLKRTKHLATTIQAKDKMIANLNKEVDKMKAKKVEVENEDLKRLLETNKELVDENRQAFEDLRYILQVFQGYLTNFQNNSQMVQLLLKKYLNGGQ